VLVGSSCLDRKAPVPSIAELKPSLTVPLDSGSLLALCTLNNAGLVSNAARLVTVCARRSRILVTLGSLPRRSGRLGELALEPSSDLYEGEEVSAAEVTAARAAQILWMQDLQGLVAGEGCRQLRSDRLHGRLRCHLHRHRRFRHRNHRFHQCSDGLNRECHDSPGVVS
jgi:hypothetical protein